MQGKVEICGINTAKLSNTDVEGMGYAIPISDVADLISELMTQTPTSPRPPPPRPLTTSLPGTAPDPSAPENRTGADYPSTSGS